MRRVLFTYLAITLLAAAPQPAAAQGGVDASAAQRLLQSGVSEQEILQQLQQSGLSREQIKARLAQAGYDPALVDRYFDQLGTGSTGAQAANAQFLAALQQIGAISTGVPTPTDTVTSSRPEAEDPPPAEDSSGIGGLPLFGRELFQRRTTEFQSILSGPVGGDYVLGPGDQLVLILTGDVEVAYTLEVMQDGSVVIPDVGVVPVNGLTMDQFRSFLYSRLGRVYSGIRRGPDATAWFDVSVSRIRTNQVIVAGDVDLPGAYPVSSLATAFTALHRAGGPSENGTFRDVQIRRGGRLVARVDIYDYLVRGDGSSDIRLQQGDFVFVPISGARVGIEGAVRRPATYELQPEEGLRDLLRFAGGVNADAIVRRVQIDRILPPDQRRPGVDRTLRDVSIEEIVDPEGPAIPLKDGDLVRVFEVSEARRNRISIAGQVHRPGTYEWWPGLTLGELVARAEGLAEQAYLPRAQIYRLDRATGERQLVTAPLNGDPVGVSLPLEDRDSVVVLSQAELVTRDSVTIAGFVKQPGTYGLAEGTTLKDLVLRAGGFVTGAEVSEAEVARMPEFTTRSDTVARVYNIDLSTNPVSGGDNGSEVPLWAPDVEDFELRDGDHVFIRKAPGYEPLRTVAVTGEVIKPSTYVLDSRATRITDVVNRAGGITGEANIHGVQLFRRGDLVAVDLEAAQDEPESRANFVLEAGDSLFIPKYDPTVLVIGNGVAFATRVPYREGAGLSYYIEQAGGYSEVADKDRVSVTYQNGQRAIVRKVLLFQRRPSPRPGSTVLVPERPITPFNPIQFTSTAIGILSSTATLLLLLSQLR